MPQDLFVLKLNGFPIFKQLQLEEAFLRADLRNWCLLNTNAPPAIVMGISGKRELLIDERALTSVDEMPIVRRFSGGGAVVTDPNTCFISWICNAEDVGVKCFPHYIHQWAAAIYAEAFPSIDISLVENDYVIGELKVGGNAQYISRERWLHHTSFLWDYDQKLMNCLLIPRKAPTYREGREHREFLCCLKEHISTKDEFFEGVFRYMCKRFCVHEVTLDEVEEVLQRPHRQSVSVETPLFIN